MRRIFLILMIALLPLRGWMGDVMAVEMSTAMASQNAVAITNIANYLYTPWENAQFDHLKAKSAAPDCPGHAAMASGIPTAAPGAAALAQLDGAVIDHAIHHAMDDASGDATNAHCNTCGVCQICHSVALTQSGVSNLPDFASHTLPAMGSDRFTSAVAALGQKPPLA
jgi:hypothetical protein